MQNNPSRREESNSKSTNQSTKLTYQSTERQSGHTANQPKLKPLNKSAEMQTHQSAKLPNSKLILSQLTELQSNQSTIHSTNHKLTNRSKKYTPTN
jgi:hypothetical protein